MAAGRRAGRGRSVATKGAKKGFEMGDSGFPWPLGTRKEPIEWPHKARLAVILTIAFEWSQKLASGEGTFHRVGSTFPKDAVHKMDFPLVSMWEYGGKVGIWRILDLLDKYDIKASFVTNGIVAERYPEATREVTRRGHEIIAHSYDQGVLLCTMRLEEEREDIRKTVSAIKKTTGVTPIGWVSPGFRSTINTPTLLVENGFMFLSDYLDDDLPYSIDVAGKPFIIIPHSNEVNDIRWFSGFTPMHVFEFFKNEFDVLYGEGETHPKLMNVAFHTYLGGRAHRTKALEAIIKYAKGFPNVWFAKREQIARWWLEHYV